MSVVDFKRIKYNNIKTYFVNGQYRDTQTTKAPSTALYRGFRLGVIHLIKVNGHFHSGSLERDKVHDAGT